MKFGFFKKSKLVDTCHADNKKNAKSNVDYDEVHEILDSELLSAGTIDTSKISASGTKELPVFDVKA